MEFEISHLFSNIQLVSQEDENESGQIVIYIFLIFTCHTHMGEHMIDF